MEKVFTGRVLCACIRATTVEESIPPERNAPSGTSAIIRSLTESRSSASSRSTASFSSGAGSLRACPADGDAAQVPEAFRRRRLPGAQRQNMAGRQLRRLAVDGARLRDVGMPQKPATASSSIVGFQPGAARNALSSEANSTRPGVAA